MQIRTLTLSLLILASTTTGALARADGDAQRAFDIPAQPLAQALRQFADQTGLQLAFETALTAGRTSPEVKGDLSTEEALARLLKGTGLRYDFLDNRTVAVSSATAKITSNSLPTSKESKESNSPLHVRGEGPGVRGLRLARAEGEDQQKSDQPSDTKDEQLSEIVVTAQRREQDLSDVPISITAIPGRELDLSTAGGALDVLATVPGVVTAESYAGSNSTVTVRGVSAPTTLGSPIAYYIDGVPFGFTRLSVVPDSSVYDLDRIEILRGPQGTLYGASALNGVIRVLTQDADPSRFEAKAGIVARSTEGGDPGYRGDAALNLPLVPDVLAIRFVGGYEETGGWIDRAARENANDGERSNVRVRLRANFTEALTLGLSAWSSRAESGAPPSSADGKSNAATLDEPSSADFDVFGLNVGYDFGSFAFAANTSFVDYRTSWNIDGTPVQFPTTVVSDFDSEVLTHELALTSDDKGAWLWSLGAMYRQGEDRQTVLAPEFAFNLSDFTDRSDSYALFGEVTRRLFSDAVEVTAGLRYFHDDAEFVDYNFPSQSNSAEFDAATPRLVLSWHANENVTLYTSYSEGFRSGLTQTGTIVTAHPEFLAADPDRLTNYEVGAKGDTFDGRLRFDAALYYMDWQDVQQAIPVDIGGILYAAVINGPSASGPGFDLATGLDVTARFELGFTFSWNDITMDGPVLSGPTTIFAKGDRLTQSPEYTAGVSASYEFPLGDWDGLVSASANYISELLTYSGGAAVSSDAMTTGRVALSITGPRNWRMGLFVDNVTDENGVSLAQFGVPDWNSRIRPRAFGLQLDYHF